MRRRLLLIAMGLFGAFILAACGPMYNTEYTFIPPKTDVGRTNVTQCLQTKSMCEQSCQMRNDECRADARRQAEHEYRSYRRERRESGHKVRKDIDSFDQSGSCNSDCNCGANYNACYTLNGGQIIPHQVCVAFCDKK